MTSQCAYKWTINNTNPWAKHGNRIEIMHNGTFSRKIYFKEIWDNWPFNALTSPYDAGPCVPYLMNFNHYAHYSATLGAFHSKKANVMSYDKENGDYYF